MKSVDNMGLLKVIEYYQPLFCNTRVQTCLWYDQYMCKSNWAEFYLGIVFVHIILVKS